MEKAIRESTTMRSFSKSSRLSFPSTAKFKKVAMRVSSILRFIVFMDFFFLVYREGKCTITFENVSNVEKDIVMNKAANTSPSSSRNLQQAQKPKGGKASWKNRLFE